MENHPLTIDPVLASVASGEDEVGVHQGASLMDILDWWRGRNKTQPAELLVKMTGLVGRLTASDLRIDMVIGDPFSAGRLGSRCGEGTGGDQGETDDCGEVHF